MEVFGNIKNRKHGQLIYFQRLCLCISLQTQTIPKITSDKTLKLRASLVALTVKNLPEMQEIQVQSLDWENPLEIGMGYSLSIYT